MCSSDKDTRAVCQAFAEEGHSAYLDGRYQTAENLYKLALTGLETASEPNTLGDVYRLIGELLADQGRLTEAEHAFRKALQIFTEYDFARDIDVAVTLSSLSHVCQAQGKFREANQFQEQAQSRLSALRQELDWQFHRLPIRAADGMLIILAIALAALWLLTAYILINREQLPQFAHRAPITITVTGRYHH